MRVLPVTVLFSFFAMASGRLVLAQSPVDDRAREQYELGFELFEAGKFEQAAVALRAAYELKPSWKILYNLAQAENNANRFAAALWAYTRYLADGGAEVPKERLTEVKGEIKRLNGLVGMVVLQGGPDGAEALVDKESKGRTPLDGPLFVDLGRHEIIVDHGGKRLFERVVTLAGGEKIVLDLAPTSGADTAADDGASTGSTLSTGSTDSAPTSAPRVWTWVAAGVGGAALIGTAITGGMAISKKNDLDDACPDGECPSGEMDNLDSARALGNAATALTVVAGVGIAAAVVLFFVEPGLGDETPDTAVGLAPLPGGAALSLGGRF